MKARITVFGAILGLGILMVSSPVLAGEKGSAKGSMMEHKGSTMEKHNSELPNVGNKICPMSGDPVDVMGEPYHVEHNGKIYNLCCKMCSKDFKKDPEKFIKIIEKELSEGADAHEGGESSHGEDDH